MGVEGRQVAGTRNFVDFGLAAFWSLPISGLLESLQTSSDGLSTAEAISRLSRYGPNLLRPRRATDSWTLFIGQFNNPLVLVLLVAAVLDYVIGDRMNPVIILVIVAASGLLGFWQERGAAAAVNGLLSIVQIRSAVQRDGAQSELPIEDIVPGDVVILNAGDVVPGDCVILEAKDLFVDEAILTGETFPAEKWPDTAVPGAPLSDRRNTLYMGTHVVSGSSRAVVVQTAKRTEFGKISERLKLKPQETEFEHGVRRFGSLLVQITLFLVVVILAVNLYFSRPVLQSLIFAAALAVGLTPQLLPAIISVNLSRGAKAMAAKRVIVKRLASIENFGSMNVLCSDKTGTLTEGRVRIHSASGITGADSDKVLLYAYLNACYETGFTNPIDEAIRTHANLDITSFRKMDEVPYDFVRKRLSILVARGDQHILITKGALSHILGICSTAETPDGLSVKLEEVRAEIEARFDQLSHQGYRVLGVCYKLKDSGLIGVKDETGMVFLGFLALFDPPKATAAATIRDLAKVGVTLKIVTGDNRFVTDTVCRQVGMENPLVLSGLDLKQMSDEALMRQVNRVDAFAEVEPNEKERIIVALKKSGNVTGFIGDGINDATALHAADVGISVDNAVDVAKDAADIVLLDKDLEVLLGGVREGRRTFANTLKYVYMAASANFGNMFSMAGASLFLPFLPLLPAQILLMNLLTDLPEMAIATDSVDQDALDQPRRWNIRSIRDFMLVFGLLSSVFDYVTFGVLLWALHATTQQFRAGWFVESVVSASIIVLVVRTRRPFFRSRPGKYLLYLTVFVCVATVVLPYTPVGRYFAFEYLPAWFLPVLFGIVLMYLVAAEVTKWIFFGRAKRSVSY